MKICSADAYECGFDFDLAISADWSRYVVLDLGARGSATTRLLPGAMAGRTSIDSLP